MKKWYKIKYFHPEGKSMPNGINYQRGWFSKECRDNMEAFLPISSEVGGILILPAQGVTSACADGSHLFTGRYVQNGVIFDNTSETVAINAKSAIEARKMAKRICESHCISTAVIKVMPRRQWFHIIFNKSPKFYLFKS